MNENVVLECVCRRASAVEWLPSLPPSTGEDGNHDGIALVTPNTLHLAFSYANRGFLTPQ